MPTYNEAGNIKELILRVERELKKDFEIIVVDDDSEDGTGKIVSDLKKDKKYLKLITRKSERGLPSAIKRGVEEARGNLVSWFDCDLGMPPEKIPQMIKMLDKFDIVVGSTFIRGGHDKREVWHAELFSKLFNLLAESLLGGGISDYTSGFIVAKKNAVKKAHFKGIHGAYFISMLYHARRNGYRITEIPYTLSPRYYGKSKIASPLSYIRAGFSYLSILIKTRFEV